MSTRSIVTVFLALVFGGSAALGVNQLRRKGQAAPQFQTSSVVVAVADISRGGMVTADMVRITEWPVDSVPDDAISKVEDVTERTVLVPIVRGEPVLVRKLADKDKGRGLAALIPKGLRAFTLQTAHVASNIAGFLLPGDKVDVLLTMQAGGQNDITGGGVTTTLLQNIEVLAVHQFLNAPKENRVDPAQSRSVTLLVTPDQAAKLDLGMNRGILHLSLRNPTDDLQADTRPALLRDLRFYQEGPRVASDEEPAAPVPVVADAGPRPEVLTVHTLRATAPGVVRIERLPNANR